MTENSTLPPAKFAAVKITDDDAMHLYVRVGLVDESGDVPKTFVSFEVYGVETVRAHDPGVDDRVMRRARMTAEALTEYAAKYKLIPASFDGDVQATRVYEVGTDYTVTANRADVNEFVFVYEVSGSFSWHVCFRGDRLDAHDRAASDDAVVQINLHEDVPPESLAASGVTLIQAASTQMTQAELAKVLADLRERVPELAKLPW